MNKDHSISTLPTAHTAITQQLTDGYVAVAENKSLELKVLNPLILTFGLPAYANIGDAGLDLRACIAEPCVILPKTIGIFKTGIAVSICDPTIVGIVAGRSGLYFKEQIRVGNGIGVIDSSYQGEICVALHNDGDKEYTVHPGERIAQFILMPVYLRSFVMVDEFTSTSVRGSNGLGSSGKQ